MAAQYLIDTYQISMWSSRPTTNLSPGTAVAAIWLYQANTFRGYAYFFPDGTPLAPPVIDPANGRVLVHYNLSQFVGILQMLRQEKPIWLFEFGPDNAGLSTGAEPTGEEEGIGG
jgi:hypothetical protein